MAWDVVSGVQPASFVGMPGGRIQIVLVFHVDYGNVFFWNEKLENVHV